MIIHNEIKGNNMYRINQVKKVVTVPLCLLK